MNLKKILIISGVILVAAGVTIFTIVRAQSGYTKVLTAKVVRENPVSYTHLDVYKRQEYDRRKSPHEHWYKPWPPRWRRQPSARPRLPFAACPAHRARRRSPLRARDHPGPAIYPPRSAQSEPRFGDTFYALNTLLTQTRCKSPVLLSPTSYCHPGQ